MDNIDNKTDKDLMVSLLAETAKAGNELKCAQRDLQKAQNRLQFVVLLANKLINRTKD